MGAEIIFWICLIGASYSYFLYPVLLWVFAALAGRRRSTAVGGDPGSISIIIAARNEEGKIAAKIENTLALDQPQARVEILVASDASDDATDSIVLRYANRGVRLVRSPSRRGKEYAQALAIQASSGDVLVFSDAGTTVPPDGLIQLERAFKDPSIGAVSSVDKFFTEGGEVEGEGLYVRYEMWLRGLESNGWGLVGLSGSFFAARRAICEGWDTQSPSDFNTALNCARAGLRAVSDSSVVGIYRNLANPSNEYHRKVRTVLRGITAIARNPDVMSPVRYGMFAWQVWSHKIMRWAVPFFLIGILISSSILALQNKLFAVILGAQALFYGVALVTHLRGGRSCFGLQRLVYFFVQVNVGILDAVLRYARGQRMVTWQPSRR